LFPFTHDKAEVCFMLITASGTCLIQSKLVVVDGNRDLLVVNVKWREFSHATLLYRLCKTKDKFQILFCIYLVDLAAIMFIFLSLSFCVCDKCSSKSGNVCGKLFCSIELWHWFVL